MFKKIVVPLDGSALAEKALPYALHYARLFDGEVVLLKGIASPLYRTDLINDALSLIKDGIEYLNVLRAIFTCPLVMPNLPYPKISIKVLDSDTPAEIAETIEAVGADTIVMTTHGRTGLSRLIMGSTAIGIIRATTLPVILVRPSKAHQPEEALKNILVTLDGTPEAELILKPTITLAKQTQATLKLLQIVKPYNPPLANCLSPYIYYSPDVINGVNTQNKARAKKYLTQIQANLTAEGVKSTVEVRFGTANQNILGYLEDKSAQMVAMATHANSYLGRVVAGSIAEEVICKSHYPLLTVHIPATAKKAVKGGSDQSEQVTLIK
jgi:nucleotide-binding universal stress UspA family protein